MKVAKAAMIIFPIATTIVCILYCIVFPFWTQALPYLWAVWALVSSISIFWFRGPLKWWIVPGVFVAIPLSVSIFEWILTGVGMVVSALVAVDSKYLSRQVFHC